MDSAQRDTRHEESAQKQYLGLALVRARIRLDRARLRLRQLRLRLGLRPAGGHKDVG